MVDFSLFRELLPHEDMIGLLDWTTGLIVLNADEAEYRAMREESGRPGKKPLTGFFPDLEHWRLSETQAHEFFHCVQAVLCGFPHKLASDLWSHVEANASQDVTSEEGQRDFHATLAQLTRASDGVTAVAILESSALLAQKRLFYPQLRERGYRMFLDGQVPVGSVYRTAYDYAESRLVGRCPPTFDLFQLLALTSLCAVDPAAAFTALVGELHVSASARPEHWRAAIKDCIVQQDIKMLGDAVEVYRAYGTYHPTFSRSLWRTATLGLQHPAELQQVFFNPHRAVDTFFTTICSPIVLRPTSTIDFVIVDHANDGGLPDDIPTKELAFSLLRCGFLIPQLMRTPSLNAAASLFEPLRRSSPIFGGTFA